MAQLTEKELERRRVQENLETFQDSRIVKVDELVEKYGSGIELDVDISYWYDDAEVIIYVRRDRMETDEEYHARIEDLKVLKVKQAASAAKRRETLLKKQLAKESNERKLYETLKAKFEGK